MHDRKINTFAVRSFREVADQDYIAARLAYRAELFPQFLWMGQQAIEKYLKFLFLAYRIPATNLGHDIEAAIKLTKKLPFPLDLSAEVLKVIEHVGSHGPYRYLEAPWYVNGHFLVRFDSAVWALRRYCIPIDHDALDSTGCDPIIMRMIESADEDAPTRYRIPGGNLEGIVANPRHFARPALIWQNAFYGPRRRQKVRSHSKLSIAHPPLMLHPEILEDLEKLIFIPKDVKAAVRDIWLPQKQAEARSR